MALANKARIDQGSPYLVPLSIFIGVAVTGLIGSLLWMLYDWRAGKIERVKDESYRLGWVECSNWMLDKTVNQFILLQKKRQDDKWEKLWIDTR